MSREVALDAELAIAYRLINDAVYRLYGITAALKEKIKGTIGERPPEIVWPQMEARATEQKRVEHVFRLLTYE